MAIWTPAQKNKTKKLKVEGCHHSYEIEIPSIRVDEAMQNVFVRLQLQAKISGFRPGKAPLDMIKRQYGGAARSEAAEQVMKQVIPEVIKDLDLRPVTMPSVGTVSFNPEAPLKFELHVEVAPNFKVTGYKGIAVVRKESAVGDKEVDDRLKHLQEGNARLEKAETETIGKEHYVVVDFDITRNGKLIEGGKGKTELVDMSSDQTIEGLTQNLLGAKRGETREFKVQVDKKSADCKVTVGEIKIKILPKLDEDFAKDMGLESLAKLRSELKSIIEKENKEGSDREVSAQIEKALLKSNPFDIPKSLLDHQLEHMLERLVSRIVGPGKSLPDQQRTDLREKMRPQAIDQVRLQFILAEIAKVEKLESTDADFDAEREKTLQAAPDDKEKAKAREFFEKNGDDVRAAIRERKVIALIRKSAKERVEKG